MKPDITILSQENKIRFKTFITGYFGALIFCIIFCATGGILLGILTKNEPSAFNAFFYSLLSISCLAAAALFFLIYAIMIFVHVIRINKSVRFYSQIQSISPNEMILKVDNFEKQIIKKVTLPAKYEGQCRTYEYIPVLVYKNTITPDWDNLLKYGCHPEQETINEQIRIQEEKQVQKDSYINPSFSTERAQAHYKHFKAVEHQAINDRIASSMMIGIIMLFGPLYTIFGSRKLNNGSIIMLLIAIVCIVWFVRLSNQ